MSGFENENCEYTENSEDPLAPIMNALDMTFEADKITPSMVDFKELAKLRNAEAKLPGVINMDGVRIRAFVHTPYTYSGYIRVAGNTIETRTPRALAELCEAADQCAISEDDGGVGIELSYDNLTVPLCDLESEGSPSKKALDAIDTLKNFEYSYTHMASLSGVSVETSHDPPLFGRVQSEYNKLFGREHFDRAGSLEFMSVCSKIDRLRSDYDVVSTEFCVDPKTGDVHVSLVTGIIFNASDTNYVCGIFKTAKYLRITLADLENELIRMDMTFPSLLDG